jgi:hypothetical protein
MNDLNMEYSNEKEAKYGEMLLSILQSEGQIESFMDVVFKFLYKRYHFILFKLRFI